MRLIVILWGLFGVATSARDNLLPPEKRSSWDTYRFLPHLGVATWVLILLGILLLGAIVGSYRLDRERQGELVRLTEDRPRLDAEVTSRVASEVQHELGHTVLMWGLHLRNVGAPGWFEAFSEVKTLGTSASDGQRRRVSFVGERGSRAHIVTGSEETLYFAMTDTIDFFKQASTVRKALVYFDKQKQEDMNIWLESSAVSPQDLVVDYEVTVISDPPMAPEWKRTYRLGPANEMHELTSAQIESPRA